MSKYVFGLNNMSKLRDFVKAVNNIYKLEKDCKELKESYNSLSCEVEKINLKIESIFDRISNVETQLQPITEPKEDWDRGFVVGEVEADKECE